MAYFAKLKYFRQLSDGASLNKPGNNRLIGYCVAYVVLIVHLITGIGESQAVLGYSIYSNTDISFISYFTVYLLSVTLTAPRLKELPLNYKTRSRYILANLYIVIAAFAILAMAVWITIYECLRAFYPVEYFSTQNSTYAVENIYPGINAYLVIFFRMIVVPACAIILSRLRGKKLWLGSIVFVICVIILAYMPVLVLDSMAGRGGIYQVANSNALFAIDILPLGWVYVVVYALLTVAVVVGSIAIVFKNEHPSEL